MSLCHMHGDLLRIQPQSPQLRKKDSLGAHDSRFEKVLPIALDKVTNTLSSAIVMIWTLN